MAANQTALTDGVDSTHLKFEKYMEQLPGVDRYFLGRCYNAVDSQIVHKRGAAAQRRSRKNMVTYQMAIRKLARRLCLDQEEQQNQGQMDEIRRTRAFLPQKFFRLMGFYGIHIVPSPAGWTFSESMTAEDMAEALNF